MIVSKTYEIEDCLDYQELNSNAHESRWTIPSNANVSYSNDGMRIAPADYVVVELNQLFSTPYSIEFTLTGYTNNNAPAPSMQFYNDTTLMYGIFWGKYSNAIGTYVNDGSIIKISSNNGKIGGVYRLECSSSGYSVYEDDVLLHSVSKSNVPSNSHLRIDVGGNRMGQFKELKVKPL